MNGTLNLYGDLFAELNRLQDSFEQAFRPGGCRQHPRAAAPHLPGHQCRQHARGD